jgi:hypothetical protein
MELYYFEKTIQAWSGNDKLALPYWNLTVPDPDIAATKECKNKKVGTTTDCPGARLPAPFRINSDDNPLYWKYRNKDANKPPPAKAKDPDPALPLCYKVVTTEKAFMKGQVFYTTEWDKGKMSFGGGAVKCKEPKPGEEPEPCYHPAGKAGEGQIERVPHDMVHGAVGDGSLMSLTNPAGAGLDPIFWPFHADIDRAWSCWQKEHPTLYPKEDVLWLNHKFTFWYAKVVEKGKPPVKMKVMKTGKEILDTAKQLNYTYGDMPCAGFELPGTDDPSKWPTS